MKILVHYCRPSFTNCYLIGTDTGVPPMNGGIQDSAEDAPAPGRSAILVDPGDMEGEIVDQIEGSDYWLRAVLITHDHPSHVRGLRTLLRIYDVDIYAVKDTILDRKTVVVKDGDLLSLDPFKIEVISVPGHSSDSVAYRIDHFLFTGDTLTAGLTGTTASSYGTRLQMTSIRNKLLSLPGNFTIFPGHGPPTTLEAERRFNAGVQMYEETRSRRPRFTVDLD